MEFIKSVAIGTGHTTNAHVKMFLNFHVPVPFSKIPKVPATRSKLIFFHAYNYLCTWKCLSKKIARGREGGGGVSVLAMVCFAHIVLYSYYVGTKIKKSSSTLKKRSATFMTMF